MKFDTDKLVDGLNSLGRKADIAVEMFAETASKKMEAYAKENRPWKDRSAAAKQRLKGSHRRIKDGRRIELAHGVDYGIFLEKAHEERYAIIQPTIDHMSPEVMKGFDRLLERM